MNQSARQDYKLDIFKLLRDELSVSVNPPNADGARPHASTHSAEAFTQILREQFQLDDGQLCELGMHLAAQGRAALTLQCTRSQLRAARLIPS